MRHGPGSTTFTKAHSVGATRATGRTRRVDVRIGVIHGPNLNLVGNREVEVYGSESLAEIDRSLDRRARDRGVELTSVQSNHEGALVDFIQAQTSSVDGWLVSFHTDIPADENPNGPFSQPLDLLGLYFLNIRRFRYDVNPVLLTNMISFLNRLL